MSVYIFVLRGFNSKFYKGMQNLYGVLCAFFNATTPMCRSPPRSFDFNSRFLGGFYMDKYFLNKQERKALNKIINDTRSDYIRAKSKRESIVDFCSIEDVEVSEMMQLEEMFYKQELLRFAEPYLTTKEYEIFKKAVYNAEKIADFKRFLNKNKIYEYRLLQKVIKKIGGLFNE